MAVERGRGPDPPGARAAGARVAENARVEAARERRAALRVAGGKRRGAVEENPPARVVVGNLRRGNPRVVDVQDREKAADERAVDERALDAGLVAERNLQWPG
ncbi:MAG TPA: hypothetical protein VE110_10890 [Gemmatimonadaceae bacterium]|nr:hypothetical protein [Gemmatimonadaceae bacterium]